eukprot:11543079-Alexandrium_andersonii.AAC.1
MLSSKPTALSALLMVSVAGHELTQGTCLPADGAVPPPFPMLDIAAALAFACETASTDDPCSGLAAL